MQETKGVGVQRPFKQIMYPRLLNNISGVHHGHFIHHTAYQSQIMGNPNYVNTNLFLHLFHQLHKLGLKLHIQSGCGKSVTASSIMQLLPTLSRIEEGEIIYYADDKQIRIDQLDRNGAQMRALRGAEMAMIFQDPMTSLNPVLTVGYQLTEALKLQLGMDYGQATKRAA